MSYLISMLGHVSAYGIRAEEACRAIIEHTIEECAFVVCQKTGLSFDFLAPIKQEIVDRIMDTPHVQPVMCRGKTKKGRVPCQRMTLYGYCSDHKDQEEHHLQKKRRIQVTPRNERTIDVRALRMMKYQF